MNVNLSPKSDLSTAWASSVLLLVAREPVQSSPRPSARQTYDGYGISLGLRPEGVYAGVITVPTLQQYSHTSDSVAA